MATTSVETSLSSLLPTLNGNLPSELVHLATSLLAQSRTRLNLKSNEEIARPYACAQIACKRLQLRLKLPTTHGRPPLPPKVYAKLLELLENSLQAKKPTSMKVDGRKAVGGSGPSPAKRPSTPKKRGVTETETPSKSTAPTSAARPSKKVESMGKVSARAVTSTGGEEEAPEWVMPLIRRLCAALNTPLLPPHVYTGVCVVLNLSGLWPRSDSDPEDELRSIVSAMSIAVYFMVWTKMKQGKTTPEVYFSRCERAIEVTAEMGCDSLSKDAVDDWVKKMNDNGWCRGQEWWDSVPEDVMDVVGRGAAEAGRYLDEQDAVVGTRRKRPRLREDDQIEQQDKDGVLLPGLGTMMQDAVDFLSAERALDYLEWKKGILERVRQVERGKGKVISVR
jgi:origin recognition complex subunit 6